MEKVFQAIGSVSFGESRTCGTLTLFPLLGRGETDPGYLTLSEALGLELVTVGEVSGAGSVPDIIIRNESDKPVFILDGEELVGAKQNRIVNISLLVPARHTLVVPVSCVEQGRWSTHWSNFRVSPDVQYARGRAMKTYHVSENLRQARGARSNQGWIWEDIDAKSRRMGASSPTSAMHDVFESYRPRIEDFARILVSAEGQIGALFAIGDSVVGLDLFDSSITCRKLLPKIIRSYAMDSLEHPGMAVSNGHLLAPAKGMLEELGKANVEVFRTAGEGQDVRLTGVGLVGAALVAWDRVVHLCAFRLENAPHRGRSVRRRLF